MQQGVTPLVHSISHFLLPLLSSKVVLDKDQNVSLEKYGQNYNLEDRPWQRDENEKKTQKKRKNKTQWRRKNAHMKNRFGQKKDAQQERGMKHKGGGGKRNRNRRGKQMKTTNLKRKKGNWGGGKKRKWKGKKKSIGKGKKYPSIGNGMKTPKWKSVLIKRVQNQNKIIRSFTFIYSYCAR